MQRHTVQMTLLGGLLAGFAGACQALPTDPEPTASAVEPAVTSVNRADDGAAPREAPQLIAGWGVPAQQDRLARARGGTDTVSNEATLSATVSNNTASHVVTGSNTIDGGSFANMTGLPMVIQNTGANVLIQNATVINLQLK